MSIICSIKQSDDEAWRSRTIFSRGVSDARARRKSVDFRLMKKIKIKEGKIGVTDNEPH